jgi:hypothetical protein
MATSTGQLLARGTRNTANVTISPTLTRIQIRRGAYRPHAIAATRTFAAGCARPCFARWTASSRVRRGSAIHAWRGFTEITVTTAGTPWARSFTRVVDPRGGTFSGSLAVPIDP